MGLEILIMGDLNAKTPNIGCQGLNKNGEVLEEVLSLEENNLCVLNDESPTFFQFKSGLTEILDLFLSYTAMAKKFPILRSLPITKWILTMLQFDKIFRISSRGTSQRFNFRKANWYKFREGFERIEQENE